MADYYPLIARAVAGIEKNTAENRRALYERARTALLSQLRSATPPLNDADITRERLALEDAIRKVEADSVRQARIDATRAAAAPSGSPPRGERLASSPRPPREPAAPSSDEKPAKAPSAKAPSAKAPLAETSSAKSPSTETSSTESPSATPPSDEPKAAPAAGEAGADAAPAAAPLAPDTRPPWLRDPQPAKPQGTEGATEPPAAPPREPRRFELRPRRGAEPALDLDGPPSGRGARLPSSDMDDERVLMPRRSYRGLAIAAILLLALVGAGAAVYWQLPNILELVSPAPGPQPVRDAAAPPRPKIDDRIAPGGQDQAPAATTGPAVAQRVVLYEEDPNDPQGNRVVGSAIWRTETVSPGPGQPPDVVVKADIEVPERKMAMTFSFRRNADQALPASHTAEVIFKLPADFPSGGVGNVPGILMKQSEQARGVPLAGVAVKVTNNYFLIALYSVDTEKERNIKLIKERSWFDIPIVYTNNRRAILAMEKGTPGERAFEEAFRAWGQ